MLKEIRESRGMSQQDLADKSGINKRMIQAYEQGYRDINGAKLSKLVTFCIVLECRLSEIVEDAQLVKDLKALEVEHEADAAPVVRGEWVNFAGDFQTAECNKCGELYDASDHADEKHFAAFKQFYKYCPNCGAKMEDKPCK